MIVSAQQAIKSADLRFREIEIRVRALFSGQAFDQVSKINGTLANLSALAPII